MRQANSACRPWREHHAVKGDDRTGGNLVDCWHGDTLGIANKMIYAQPDLKLGWFARRVEPFYQREIEVYTIESWGYAIFSDKWSAVGLWENGGSAPKVSPDKSNQWLQRRHPQSLPRSIHKICRKKMKKTFMSRRAEASVKEWMAFKKWCGLLAPILMDPVMGPPVHVCLVPIIKRLACLVPGDELIGITKPRHQAALLQPIYGAKGTAEEDSFHLWKGDCCWNIDWEQTWMRIMMMMMMMMMMVSWNCLLGKNNDVVETFHLKTKMGMHWLVNGSRGNPAHIRQWVGLSLVWLGKLQVVEILIWETSHILQTETGANDFSLRNVQGESWELV